MAVFALILVFVGAATWKILPRLATPSRVHSITIEEREAVAMDLERLDSSFSDLSKPIANFRKVLLVENASVVELPASDKMVWQNNGSLVFASRFFLSDSGTQEISLLKVLLPSEVAVRPLTPPGSVGGQE